MVATSIYLDRRSSSVKLFAFHQPMVLDIGGLHRLFARLLTKPSLTRSWTCQLEYVAASISHWFALFTPEFRDWFTTQPFSDLNKTTCGNWRIKVVLVMRRTWSVEETGRIRNASDVRSTERHTP